MSELNIIVLCTQVLALCWLSYSLFQPSEGSTSLMTGAYGLGCKMHDHVNIERGTEISHALNLFSLFSSLLYSII